MEVGGQWVVNLLSMLRQMCLETPNAQALGFDHSEAEEWAQASGKPSSE